MFYKRQKGFTLIELLVVIAIIGILATIVLVSLNSARAKARDTRRIGDIRQVALALEMYADDNSAKYPAAHTACVNLSTLSTTLAAYITVPNDPLTTAHYQYGTKSDDTRYVLVATLESSTNPALATDIDTATYNCTCTDPVYCIAP